MVPAQPRRKEINGARFYEINGEWYPSVTTVLRSGAKPSRPTWTDKGKTSSEDAMARGTAIHEYCDRRLRGYRVARKIPDHLQPYWASLQPSLRRITCRHLSEEFVWHRAVGYAGTLDLVAKFRGELTLIDFKTTGALKRVNPYLEDYKLQITAYAAALEDSTGIAVRQGAVIVAHPEGPALEVIIPSAELGELWPVWVQRCEDFNKSVGAKSVNISQAFRW